MIKKILLFLVLLLVFSFGYTQAYDYFHSVDVLVYVKNGQSVEVKYKNKVVAHNTSGTSVHFRQPEFSDISVFFKSKEPYESSQRTISVGDKSLSKTIYPYFSNQELSKRTLEDESAIKAAILVYNPKINDIYKITNLRLYHYAEWASADLVWSGDYGQNSDTLHVVLKYDNSKWSLVGNPNILLYQGNYSSVPLDILESINNNQ